MTSASDKQDRFDIPALRLAVDAAAFMAGRGSAEGMHAVMKETLRQVATEEALRVLDELETGGMGFDPEQEEALARLRARIVKGEF